jgi:hypothetical protein
MSARKTAAWRIPAQLKNKSPAVQFTNIFTDYYNKLRTGRHAESRDSEYVAMRQPLVHGTAHGLPPSTFSDPGIMEIVENLANPAARRAITGESGPIHSALREATTNLVFPRGQRRHQVNFPRAGLMAEVDEALDTTKLLPYSGIRPGPAGGWYVARPDIRPEGFSYDALVDLAEELRRLRFGPRQGVFDDYSRAVDAAAKRMTDVGRNRFFSGSLPGNSWDVLPFKPDLRTPPHSK